VKTIRTFASELLGLFVEDWSFAIHLAATIGTLILLDAFSVGTANTRALLLVALPAMVLLLNVAPKRKR
jgi:uncharacterized membrane protein